MGHFSSMARQSTGGTLDSSREKIIFFRWVGLYLKESSLEVNEIGLSEGNLLNNSNKIKKSQIH